MWKELPAVPCCIMPWERKQPMPGSYLLNNVGSVHDKKMLNKALEKYLNSDEVAQLCFLGLLRGHFYFAPTLTEPYIYSTICYQIDYNIYISKDRLGEDHGCFYISHATSITT